MKVATPMKKTSGTTAMKVVRAMKVSKIAKGKRAKVRVFQGRCEKTSGGLKKANLMKNKAGKVVSKSLSVAAKKRYASTVGKWILAVTKARKALGINGFLAVKKESPLYKKALQFYHQ